MNWIKFLISHSVVISEFRYHNFFAKLYQIFREIKALNTVISKTSLENFKFVFLAQFCASFIHMSMKRRVWTNRIRWDCCERWWLQWIISLQSWLNWTKIYLVFTAYILKTSKLYQSLISLLHSLLSVLISTFVRSTHKIHFWRTSICKFWNSFSRKIFSGDSKMPKLTHCAVEN